MNAAPSNEKESDGKTQTLGDLLYADEEKARPLEQDWVVLVESIASGSEAALHELYNRTHHLVFTLVMRITNNVQAAEELTLDVFHDVWRRASQYHADGGPVIGWIMNQARSRAIDRLRYDGRKKRMPVEDAVSAASEVNDLEEAADLRSQGAALQAALVVLTADERQAIEVTFFSGLTYAEAAIRLNQPLGTIKTRIRSGLGKLRQALHTGPTSP